MALDQSVYNQMEDLLVLFEEEIESRDPAAAKKLARPRAKYLARMEEIRGSTFREANWFAALSAYFRSLRHITMGFSEPGSLSPEAAAARMPPPPGVLLNALHDKAHKDPDPPEVRVPRPVRDCSLSDKFLTFVLQSGWVRNPAKEADLAALGSPGEPRILVLDHGAHQITLAPGVVVVYSKSEPVFRYQFATREFDDVGLGSSVGFDPAVVGPVREYLTALDS